MKGVVFGTIIFVVLMTNFISTAFADYEELCESQAKTESKKSKACKKLDKIQTGQETKKITSDTIKQLNNECNYEYETVYNNCIVKYTIQEFKRAAKLAKMKEMDFFNWLNPEIPMEDCHDKSNKKWEYTDVNCDDKHNCVCITNRDSMAKSKGEEGCTDVLNVLYTIVSNAKKQDQLDCDIMNKYLALAMSGCNAIKEADNSLGIGIDLNKFKKDQLELVRASSDLVSQKCNKN